MTDISIPGGRIRSFIERVENLDTELQELSEQKKEVFAEAKAEGFDVKILAVDDKDRIATGRYMRGGKHKGCRQRGNKDNSPSSQNDLQQTSVREIPPAENRMI